MLDNANAEEVARRIQDLNRQIESRQSSVERITREKESRMRDFDHQLSLEGHEIALLEGRVIEMKIHLRE